MKKFIDPFIDFLPTIDLHGEDRISAVIMVNQFIDDNLKLKKKKIVIVHGIGSGILKNEIHNCLKNSKKVNNYQTYYNNPGITIVNLK